MDAKSQTKKGGDVAGRLLQKLLMPIVATAASAAATYAAKKGPELFDSHLKPKLRELANGAGGAAHDLPDRAKAAAGGAGDVAEKLADRARSVAGGAAKTAGDTVRSATGSNGHKPLSTRELDRRVNERGRARAARRKAST
jgi:hypothetical protein